MTTFHLELLSPERAFYSGDCTSLIVPVSDGMMGVMANHSPMTAAIFDGQLSFTKPDGETVICAVTRGLLDVSGGNATALCGEIILPEEIDVEREMRFVEKASERLKRRQSHQDYLMSKLSLADAMSNLEVKRRSAARNALK